MEPLYERPDESLDPRFDWQVQDMRIERLHEGSRWAEGPVYLPAARCLLWSDIPNDRILRWDETTGATGVFRQPAGWTNGNVLDAAGRLISCEQGRRRITRTEHDGSITVIAERFRGKRLNSPNDAVVARDGAIWFTDATYGIDGDYEGERAQSELGARHLFRLDPSGELRSMADDFQQPTGLGFSPDGTRLYVADSRANHMRVFTVGEDGTLAGGEVFGAADGAPGVRFDSLDVDVNGRVWLAAGWDGVRCYDPDGTLLGRILTPECASNCVFGGRKRTRLFITASTSVYSITLAFGGVPRAYDTAIAPAPAGLVRSGAR